MILHISNYLNLVFGSSIESRNHWDNTLKQELIYKYGESWIDACRMLSFKIR